MSMDLRKVIDAMIAAEPKTPSDARKVIADAMGEDASTFFNMTLADLVRLAGSMKVGDVFEFAVEHQ